MAALLDLKPLSPSPALCVCPFISPLLPSPLYTSCHLLTMVLRHSLGRHASRQLRPQSYVTRRGLAAPASGSFQYQTGEAGGVKYASRDLAGPTTTLALVSRAGTRYQPLPGLAEGLEKYAFRVCHSRTLSHAHTSFSTKL